MPTTSRSSSQGTCGASRLSSSAYYIPIHRRVFMRSVSDGISRRGAVLCGVSGESVPRERCGVNRSADSNRGSSYQLVATDI